MIKKRVKKHANYVLLIAITEDGQTEDEINVPIALSAFRDKNDGQTDTVLTLYQSGSGLIKELALFVVFCVFFVCACKFLDEANFDSGVVFLHFACSSMFDCLIIIKFEIRDDC